jgi:PTH1 family peptidyl-tRNA hydrolase
MKIIIGLGNPGQEYANTRHNAGFMLTDKMAEAAGAIWRENKKFKALVAEAGEIVFVKPQTFMNNSGESASLILSYYKLLPKTLGILKNKNADLSKVLTVIHDDLDIDFGQYKISIDSRSAGHRGVQSIINHLKTQNFKRIRLGIKKTAEQERIPTEKYVLMKFRPEEKLILEKLFKKIQSIL